MFGVSYCDFSRKWAGKEEGRLTPPFLEQLCCDGVVDAVGLREIVCWTEGAHAGNLGSQAVRRVAVVPAIVRWEVCLAAVFCIVCFAGLNGGHIRCRVAGHARLF